MSAVHLIMKDVQAGTSSGLGDANADRWIELQDMFQDMFHVVPAHIIGGDTEAPMADMEVPGAVKASFGAARRASRKIAPPPSRPILKGCSRLSVECLRNDLPHHVSYRP
ncbi:hypothetical protein [Xanthobacter agilis]|uniref:hypothetical protein n=1 Tax=Xanthobacter agilis TaxID=47492 RepID=UPI0037276BE3